MLTLITASEGTYRHHGHNVPLSSGMVGLVFPDAEIGLQRANEHSPYAHYFCRFAGDQATAVAQRIAEANGNQPFFYVAQWESLISLFQELCARKVVYEDDLNKDLFLSTDALLAALLAQLEYPKSSTTNGVLLAKGSLRQYMIDRINQPMDIELMAQYFNLSKSHLCRKAKQLSGETLIQIWRTIKMEWAGQLLIAKELKIVEVARCVGYDDPFYFSHCFKLHHGISPRAWRERNISDAQA